MSLPRLRLRIGVLMCMCFAALATTVRANEIWVAPTLQTDTGGLGVGNGIWPVSPKGVTRLVVAVPDDLQTFQGARIVLIPSAPAGAGVLHVHICTAENSDMVGASCSGPIDQAFVGVANQLAEVDVSAALAPHVTDPGTRYLAIAAYTTPTFTTDHIAGLRFAYVPMVPPGVATLGANTFTGTQTAPAFVGDGSGLANVSANLLDGLDSTAFASAVHGHDVSQVTNAARLAGGNVFTATQTIDTGNLDLDPSTATAGNILKNGQPFLHNFGNANLFAGLGAGNLSTTGFSNTGVGHNSLTANTSGLFNSALGAFSLAANTTGSSNVAVGVSAMKDNTVGLGNTVVGMQALQDNTSGSQNTAVGTIALSRSTGDGNAAVGSLALNHATTGSNNVAIGFSAGANLTDGSNNIYLGANLFGVASESNTMYLGNGQTATHIAGVRGTTVSDGEMVVVDASGRLGSAPLGSPGANSVGTNEVLDDSLTQDDLAPDSVGASEVAFNYAGSSSEGGAASNAELLDGIDSAAFALAAHGHDVSQVTNAARLASNTFTATQTIDNGNLDLDNSTATTGNITKNGMRFIHNGGAPGSGANTFLGENAGNFTFTGCCNTGIGWQALFATTSGSGNTAHGTAALMANTTGSQNTAVGLNTLFNNTSGGGNTATGQNALVNSSTGSFNSAYGVQALQHNTTGFGNTAVGRFAIGGNTTGHNNVAVGFNAGANLGSGGLTGSNNIYLGANVFGQAGESNVMYFGNQDPGMGATITKAVMAGVRGTTTGVADAIPVVIDSAGQLGTISSSRRFKEDIHDMPTSISDRLLRLRPVTFRYTQAFTNGSKPVQYGLVAEEVAEVFPELAVRGADGQVETVHYETLNVLLLKQVQELRAALVQQQAQQQREIEQLKARVEELIRQR